MILSKTIELERIVKRSKFRHRRKLTSKLLKKKIYKHNGRDLYELSITELQQLLLGSE